MARGGALVDTSGTYTPSTASATSTYVDQLDEVTLTENGSYKISMNFKVDAGESGKGTIKVSGHIGSEGDYDLTLKMSAEGENMTISAIYDKMDEKVYASMKGQGVDLKIASPVTEGDEFEEIDSYLFGTSSLLSTEGIKSLIQSSSEYLNIELAETDSYVKVKYVGTGDMEGYTYYVVFNKSGEELTFGGVRVEMDMTTEVGGSSAAIKGYVEFASSTESVKTLTESQKAEYLSM